MPRWSAERALIAALVVYAVLSRAFIALVIPPWQGPDETKHFEYARLLFDKRDQLIAERRLFRVDDASPELQTQIIASMARHQEIVGVFDEFNVVNGHGGEVAFERRPLATVIQGIEQTGFRAYHQKASPVGIFADYPRRVALGQALRD